MIIKIFKTMHRDKTNFKFFEQQKCNIENELKKNISIYFKYTYIKNY